MINKIPKFKKEHKPIYLADIIKNTQIRCTTVYFTTSDKDLNISMYL